MNGTVHIGENYTASCMIKANPKMNLYAWSSPGCDYDVKIPHVGQYTTKATIMLHNVTAHCMDITCSTSLFQESRGLGKES